MMKGVRFGIDLSCLPDQTLCLVDPAGSQGDLISSFSVMAIVGVISKSAFVDVSVAKIENDAERAHFTTYWKSSSGLHKEKN